MAKTIGLVGASGWLGQKVAEKLRDRGDEVVGFSRSERSGNGISWRQWDGKSLPDVSGLDALINLAGEPIFQRWNEKVKKRLRDSRVDLSAKLAEAVRGSEVSVFLNASAVGIYGDRGDEVLTEESGKGDGYLADLTADWEDVVTAKGDLGARVAFLRTGIVLGKDGGAWETMAPIFKTGIGGKLGDGQQFMPWIHLEDEVNAIIFLLDQEVSGPVNLTAPEPVRNETFTKEVGDALGRPTWIPAPKFGLKLALGEFAEEGLLASQRVVPRVLEREGFEFRFPGLRGALGDLV